MLAIAVTVLSRYRTKMAASLCRKAFHHYNRLLRLQYSTGYVILIPEAPQDLPENEIFSKTGHLVRFDKIEAKHCKSLMVRNSQMYDVGAWEVGEQIKSMLEKNEKIDLLKNIIEPLELLFVPFFSSWGLVETLHYANDSYMPQKMYLPLTQGATDVREDKFKLEAIYKVCKKLFDEQSDKFNSEEKRVLQKFVYEGRLYGLDLNPADRAKYMRLMEQINMRRRTYICNWKNYMMTFKKVIYDPAETSHFPPDLLRNSALDIEKPEEGPWILSLYSKVYYRFMEYCDTRQTRLNMWLTRRQICSKHGDQRYRAVMEVEDIRMKRSDLAVLLGYPTFAHLIVHYTMAGSLDNVYDMLDTLLEKAKLGQEEEINELEEFARKNNFAGQIELWDIPYWGRLQKKDLYHFDEIALQEYFPLPRVLQGLFSLCEQLFGIIIQEEKEVKSWHPDTRHFRVFDERTKQDLGGFYFDPYARKGKDLKDSRGGQSVVISLRSKICGTLPSVSLLFEFAPPTEDKPSLLLFREVEDLFSQFAFALQHILSDTQLVEASGLSYVEKDTAEVCSHFLTYWLYERGTLKSVSGHYNTGKPLPTHIIEGIGKMKHHLAGTDMCQSIYKARLDLNLGFENECCMPIAEKLWPEHFLFDLNDYDHHPFSYKDMFIGRRACSHFGSIWSQVIAADAFSAFTEAGLTNYEEVTLLGKRFRSTYFALAGGCHPAEVFRKFRGRDPSPLPLLNLVGLKDLTPSISSSEDSSKITAN